jgi:hypothetical protein
LFIEERILDTRYVITICPGYSAESGVEISRNRKDRLDDDIPGKKLIQTEAKIVRIRDLLVDIKMCIKIPGMNTGIGPATSNHIDLITEQDA